MHKPSPLSVAGLVFLSALSISGIMDFLGEYNEVRIPTRPDIHSAQVFVGIESLRVGFSVRTDEDGTGLALQMIRKCPDGSRHNFGNENISLQIVPPDLETLHRGNLPCGEKKR